MNILFASSESVPYVKTGGLADVVGALTEVLALQKHDVVLILPLYRRTRDQFGFLQQLDLKLKIPMGDGSAMIRVWESPAGKGVRVLFVDSVVFDRNGIYGDTPADAYHDNDYRYGLFSRAVLEVTKAISFRPDIIHCHDWQTGLVPAYLKYVYAQDSFFKNSASVFTIHNMAYQGVFPASALGLLGLPGSAFQPKEMEFYGQLSTLKAGLVYADGITTVSPTYATEVSSDPAYGCGLEGVLQERRAHFEGILNGLDVASWNPQTDTQIKEQFSKSSVAGRTLCKADLQRTMGVPVDTRVPVMGFIARLDYQKGVDIMIKSIHKALKDGAQLTSLGQGNPQYLEGLNDLVRRFPKQVSHETAFAEPLAHKIYAGSDIFLMPSRYEPCGLSQMIAMRYGAVPVVTPTGGLLDTVVAHPDPKSTGFISAHTSEAAFAQSIDDALAALKKKTVWAALQKRGMAKDFSWKLSSKTYIAFYDSLLKKRRLE